MKILAIETSCDETSAAVVENGRHILSNIIASQIDLHQQFGGVVPEVASRRHLELITPTIDTALQEANTLLSDIDAIAVINRPGLVGALIVGVAAAKTIAFAASLPLIPVHHIEAHIYANWLTDEEIELPAVCLVVSGGHSNIFYMKEHGSFEQIAKTRDDAAGEAFDKCARAMGLGYPGGPLIDKLAKDGNPKAIRFPRSRFENSLDFSFSGLKTAVIRYVRDKHESESIADIAASFQQAVVDVLVKHTFEAAETFNVKQILVAGGVAANSALNNAMKETGIKNGIKVNIPKPILCTDNAAMVGAAGFYNYELRITAGLDLDCIATGG